MKIRYKITILAAATVALALFTASNSFATGGCDDTIDSGTQTFSCAYSGGTVDSGNGANIMVTLSPGVIITYKSGQQAGGANAAFYGLETQNNNVHPENRNEYGFASDYSGFYMKPTTATALDAIQLGGTNAYSAFSNTNGWTPMGGSS